MPISHVGATNEHHYHLLDSCKQKPDHANQILTSDFTAVTMLQVTSQIESAYRVQAASVAFLWVLPLSDIQVDRPSNGL